MPTLKEEHRLELQKLAEAWIERELAQAALKDSQNALSVAERNLSYVFAGNFTVPVENGKSFVTITVDDKYGNRGVRQFEYLYSTPVSLEPFSSDEKDLPELE